MQIWIGWRKRGEIICRSVYIFKPILKNQMFLRLNELNIPGVVVLGAAITKNSVLTLCFDSLRTACSAALDFNSSIFFLASFRTWLLKYFVERSKIFFREYIFSTDVTYRCKNANKKTDLKRTSRLNVVLVHNMFI